MVQTFERRKNKDKEDSSRYLKSSKKAVIRIRNIAKLERYF